MKKIAFSMLILMSLAGCQNILPSQNTVQSNPTMEEYRSLAKNEIIDLASKRKLKPATYEDISNNLWVLISASDLQHTPVDLPVFHQDKLPLIIFSQATKYQVQFDNTKLRIVANYQITNGNIKILDKLDEKPKQYSDLQVANDNDVIQALSGKIKISEDKKLFTVENNGMIYYFVEVVMP